MAAFLVAHCQRQRPRTMPNSDQEHKHGSACSLWSIKLVQCSADRLLSVETASLNVSSRRPSTMREKFERYASNSFDRVSTELFCEYLEAEDCFLRSNLEGHFTGSAWLVSADGQRVLLTHHRKLDRWLQLGGHADGDSDLSRVALREAEEESGLTDLVVESEIFDLDRHWIPERIDVPGHWHYDVRFVVRARGSEAFVVSDESHALAWRDIAEVAIDSAADESLRRMAGRWLEGRQQRQESGMGNRE